MRLQWLVGPLLFAGSLCIPLVVGAQQYATSILSLPAGYTQVFSPGSNAGLAIGGGQEIAQAYSFLGQPTTNVLYTGSTHTIVDFGANNILYGVGGGRQVGSVGTATSAIPAFWSGSSGSPTLLLSSNDQSLFRGALAYGTDGVQQIGYGYRVTQPTGALQYHALLWNGQAAGFVDLHPSAYSGSYALGVSNGLQVGVGGSLGDSPIGNSGTGGTALLWSGSASSVVSLAPSGFSSSLAYGTDGVQEVGWGTPNSSFNSSHALLWSGSAASAIDLNPVGFSGSQAYGLRNGIEVGYGLIGSGFNPTSHALAWSGSAGSYVDLSVFLPSGYTNSAAYSIDSDGTIFGTATNAAGRNLPVLWTPIAASAVPEPGSLALLTGISVTGIGFLARRRRQTHNSA